MSRRGIVHSMRFAVLLLCAPEVLAAQARPGWLGFGFTYHHERATDGHTIGWFTVHRVAPGGPAEKAGLKAHDVVTEVDGRTLDFASDFQALEWLGKIRPQQRVILSVRRGTSKSKVTLLAAPMNDGQFAKWKKNLEAAKGKD